MIYILYILISWFHFFSTYPRNSLAIDHWVIALLALLKQQDSRCVAPFLLWGILCWTCMKLEGLYISHINERVSALKKKPSMKTFRFFSLFFDNFRACLWQYLFPQNSQKLPFSSSLTQKYVWTRCVVLLSWHYSVSEIWTHHLSFFASFIISFFKVLNYRASGKFATLILSWKCINRNFSIFISYSKS